MKKMNEVCFQMNNVILRKIQSMHNNINKQLQMEIAKDEHSLIINHFPQHCNNLCCKQSTIEFYNKVKINLWKVISLLFINPLYFTLKIKTTTAWDYNYNI